MRSKKTLAILLFILLPAFMYPAFSLTPEQCRVATESCMSKCPGLWPPRPHRIVMTNAIRNCPAPARALAHLALTQQTKVPQVPQRGHIRLLA